MKDVNGNLAFCVFAGFPFVKKKKCVLCVTV